MVGLYVYIYMYMMVYKPTIDCYGWYTKSSVYIYISFFGMDDFGVAPVKPQEMIQIHGNPYQLLTVLYQAGN